MRKFKTKKDGQIYDLTEKNCRERLIPRETYYVQIGQHHRWIALCPVCENPIQLIGITGELKRTINGKEISINPYGRHIVKRYTELSGTFREDKYLHCPLSSKYKVVGLKNGEHYVAPTQVNFDVYNLLKENFDTAIYILARSMGIQYIKESDAQKILESYISMDGYMDKFSQVYNTPWMLFTDSSANLRLWNLNILPNTKLYEYLKTREDIKLIQKETKSGSIVYNVQGNDCYLNDYIEFGYYERKKKANEDIEETVEMRIYRGPTSGKEPAEVMWRTYIDIPLDWYINTINSKNRFRNNNLLDIANITMPKIE
jgi:hypothetical protein